MNKTNSIVIEENDPFYFDKMDREAVAQNLTEQLEKIYESCILLINGKGDSGKTTFIKMWKQELINFGHNTLFHNAVENEYSENPMAAIVTELLEEVNDLDEGEKIPPTVKWNFKSISGAIDILSNSGMHNVKSRMELFALKKKSLNEIKTGLSSIIKEHYTNEEGQFTQIYFFIDELDKCKPEYVIEMLRVVAGVVNIPEIIFIISADRMQLVNALKTIYGNEFDTENYFKNLFDLECNLDEKENS